MGAVVRRDPGTLREMIGQMPDGTFLVRFPGGPMIPVPSVSDTEVVLGSNDGNQGIWLNVIEKAYGELVLARRGLEAPAIDALSAAGTSTKTLQLFTGHEGASTAIPAARVSAHPGPRRDRGSGRGAGHPDRGPARPPVTCCGTTTAATPPWITRTTSTPYSATTRRATSSTSGIRGGPLTPAGPPGLAAGYPVQDGHFSVSLDDFIRIFAAITYESRRPAPTIRTGLR